jgi:hypothetical protein
VSLTSDTDKLSACLTVKPLLPQQVHAPPDDLFHTVAAIQFNKIISTVQDDAVILDMAKLLKFFFLPLDIQAQFFKAYPFNPKVLVHSILLSFQVLTAVG